MIKSIAYSFFFILLLSIPLSTQAQEAVTARPSPLAVVTMKYENTYIKVTYSQPHKRGREIFGGLVPYGQVWRSGANEATEITITGNVLFGNDTLQAGTYSIFTIPEKDKWTIIVNSQLGQWGAYNYHEKSDVMRVELPVQKIKEVVYEPFTILFEQKNSIAELVMLWDDTKVALPIQFLD